MKRVFNVKALVFRNGMPALQLEDLPTPRPEEGEALIRVLKAGICNTDLEILKGYMGFEGVPGHEFVGVVEEGGADLRGKRVVGSINLSCGVCESCRKGIPNHCLKIKTLGINGKNGAFAEYLTLTEDNLYVLPESVSDTEAVFVEPLAAAIQVKEQVNIRPSEKVAVLGDGKLGMLVALSLHAFGHEATLLGRHPEKMEIGERQGISTALSGDGMRDMDQEFDVIVECTGRASGLSLAASLIKPRGKIVMKTTCAGSQTIDAAPLVVKEITLIGSRCGPFAPAIRMLSERRIDVRTLVSGEYPLSRFKEAFKRAEEGDSLKVIFDMV